MMHAMGGWLIALAAWSPQEPGTGLVVKTDPAGASVRLNRGERTWNTPCDIPASALRRGSQEVVITLEGYEPAYRTVPTDARRVPVLEVKLTPKSGSIVLTNAVPGSTVALLQILGDVRDVGTILRLWSENEAALLAAVGALPDAEAPLVAARLQELAAAAPEKVAAAAKAKLAKAEPARAGVEISFRAIADIEGVARFPRVPVTNAYHLLATRPGSPDFVQANVKADVRPTAIRVPAAKAPEPPKPPPAVAEAAPPGPAKLRLRGPAGPVRISAGDRVVADATLRPDEPLAVSVPAGLYRVEFLDARTGAVTHAVETVAAADAAEAPRESERVGRVHLVHRVYGVFVRLEPGFDLLPGEDVVIYREGVEVARSKIIQVCAGDETYPDGAAQVTREGGAIREGDEARRFK